MAPTVFYSLSPRLPRFDMQSIVQYLRLRVLLPTRPSFPKSDPSPPLFVSLSGAPPPYPTPSLSSVFATRRCSYYRPGVTPPNSP